MVFFCHVSFVSCSLRICGRAQAALGSRGGSSKAPLSAGQDRNADNCLPPKSFIKTELPVSPCSNYPEQDSHRLASGPCTIFV